MLHDDVTSHIKPITTPQITRIADVSAMLRIMGPLNSSLPDAVVGQRRLLADLCRFIGVQVGTVPPESLGFAPIEKPSASGLPEPPVESQHPAVGEMSPRLEQTLQHLLAGNSEKQVARLLDLSRHTVHVYVKALYKRFGVSSRAELLAKHLKR